MINANTLQEILLIVADAHSAEQLMYHDDSQFTRRTYIRSLFSAIEGVIWRLKQALLETSKNQNLNFQISPGEEMLLTDKTYELKNNGKIKEQPKFLKLADNLKFTLSILSRYTGTIIDIGIGTPDWEAFISAQAIRNRITHPRSAAELSISDAEIAACRKASSWFNILTVTSTHSFVRQQLKQ